jgi:hypothetical protein
MQTRLTHVVVAFLLIAGLGLPSAFAGEKGGQRPLKDEGFRKAVMEDLHTFAQKQHETRRAHYEQQMEENRDFHKTLKGKSQADLIAAIKAHREQQFSENQDFRAQQEQRRVDFIKAEGQKENIAQERVDKVLARVEERYQEAMDFFDKRHVENMAFLDKLAATPGLTHEKLREELKAHFEARRAELRTFLEGLRARLKARGE